jgi:hypothetical protein
MTLNHGGHGIAGLLWAICQSEDVSDGRLREAKLTAMLNEIETRQVLGAVAPLIAD